MIDRILRKRDLKDGPDFLTGSLFRQIPQLTIPMSIGVLANTLFNIVDIYFVTQLGKEAAAAMGYVFPVIIAFNAVFMGLSVGALSVVSRAIGRHRADVKSVCWDLLILGTLIAILMAVAGFGLNRILFETLGASGRTLDLVSRFMNIWYLGVPFLAIPILANGLMRGMGLIRFSVIIMVSSAIFNAVLDPIFIFGFAFIAPMGIEGAAMASLVARVLTLLVSLAVLFDRSDYLLLFRRSFSAMWSHWREALHVGLPSALSNLIFPAGLALITSVLSTFGSEALAAFAIVSRFETFAIIPLLSLAMIIGPVVGQNWGANNKERVLTALRSTVALSTIWAVVAALFFGLFARHMLELVTTDLSVQKLAVLYLYIVPLSYAGLGASISSVAAYNAIGKPLVGFLLNIMRFIGFYLPLAITGAAIWGVVGVFIGAAASNLLSGALALYANSRLRRLPGS